MVGKMGRRTGSGHFGGDVVEPQFAVGSVDLECASFALYSIQYSTQF